MQDTPEARRRIKLYAKLFIVVAMGLYLLLTPGPKRNPQLYEFEKLTYGMTKAQVASVIGDFSFPPPTDLSLSQDRAEFYADGMRIVLYFRAPTNGDGAPVLIRAHVDGKGVDRELLKNNE